MIGRIGKAVLALALVALAAAPALAQNHVAFEVSVVGDNQEAVTAATCRVNTAGANTLATIYTNPTLATAASNPLTVDSGGRCRFYADAATYSAVDVIVSVPSGAYKGSHARVDNVTRTGQKRVLVNRSSAAKKLSVRFTATASTSTTTASETVPAGAKIVSAVIETTTAVAASTFNANMAGIQGSICANVTTAAVGFAGCNLDGNAGTANSASAAVTYHNQNHASAGFIHILYFEAGNDS